MIFEIMDFRDLKFPHDNAKGKEMKGNKKVFLQLARLSDI